MRLGIIALIFSLLETVLHGTNISHIVKYGDIQIHISIFLNSNTAAEGRRLTGSCFIKRIFKIGPAIPAQIKREAVKVCQGTGKMHQAFWIITVLQVKKMPQFMQSDFGRSIVQAGLCDGGTIQVMAQPVKGDDRIPASLAGLAVDMLEYRHKDIDTQNSHDFEIVFKGEGFNIFQNGAGIVLQALFVKSVSRVFPRPENPGRQVIIAGDVGGNHFRHKGRYFSQ